MPPDLLPVLHHAYSNPFTTRSDFARSHTDLIAEAACRGLITVHTPYHGWGRRWHITASGLTILEAITDE